jgi:hypothetical protein
MTANALAKMVSQEQIVKQLRLAQKVLKAKLAKMEELL